MTTKGQNRLIAAFLALFLIWFAVSMFKMQGIAHDMEMAELEISLQAAEHRAEEYRWETLEARQEKWILEDMYNQLEARSDEMQYGEDGQ